MITPTETLNDINNSNNESDNNEHNERSYSISFDGKMVRSIVKVETTQLAESEYNKSEQELAIVCSRANTIQSHATSTIITPTSVTTHTSEIMNDKVTGAATLRVSISKTILHRVITNNSASNLIFILYNRIMLAISVIIIVAYNICGELGIKSYYINLPLLIYQLLFVIFIILSFNVTVTKQIMKTFEFWFKLLYWIRFCVLSIIVYWVHLDLIDYTIHIVNTFVLVAFCLIDGLKVPIKVKAPLMIIVSVIFSLMAYRYTEDSLKYIEITKLNVFGWNIQLNLLVMAASSIRTVCIFFWKQTITAIIHQTKSSMIKTSTNITWLM
eukprot:210690_1